VFRVTTSIDAESGRSRLALEGRLAGESVDEFSRAFREAEAESSSSLTLDLTGRTFVDARGALALRRLAERGVRLVGGSPFVALSTGSMP
jgi:anti-anti-sigma regulatory factor